MNIYIFVFLLKDGTLHNEGKFLNYQKNSLFLFPTYEEKIKGFEK
jgi:hypothetical protein